MKGVTNEYEVTITPEGSWSIRHIHGDQSRQIVVGEVSKDQPNVMGRAEEAANRYLRLRKMRDAEAKRRAEGTKVYTVKA